MANLVFIAASILLLWQKMCFVMTKMILVVTKDVFCCDQNDPCCDKRCVLSWPKWYLWQLLPVILPLRHWTFCNQTCYSTLTTTWLMGGINAIQGDKPCEIFVHPNRCITSMSCFSSTHLTLFAESRLFSVPRMGRRTLGERSFQYVGPVIRNPLPLSQCLTGISSSLSSFKSELKPLSSAYWSVVFSLLILPTCCQRWM